MQWGRQAKKSDSELRALFVRGLLPCTRAFVMSKQPDSFRAALEAARLGITVQSVTEEQSSSPSVISQSNQAAKSQISNVCSNSSIENLVSSVQNLSTRLKTVESRPTYVSRSNRQDFRQSRPNRSVVCHRCGYTGHKWRNCFAKKSIDGVHLN